MSFGNSIGGSRSASGGAQARYSASADGERARPADGLDHLVDVRVLGEEAPEVRGAVAQQPLLDQRVLELQDVPGFLLLLPACSLVCPEVPERQRRQARHPIGHRRGEGPRQHRAPVMPDEVCLVDADGVQHARDVGDRHRRRVLSRVGRFVGTTKTPEIERDRAIAGLDEGGDLMSVHVVGIGKAVHQQDGLAGSLVEDVQCRSVDVGPHAFSSVCVQRHRAVHSITLSHWGISVRSRVPGGRRKGPRTKVRDPFLVNAQAQTCSKPSGPLTHGGP